MTPDGARSVTIVDVARAAGVSKATASRALRGDKDSSPGTQKHVLSIARQLGYVVNAHAQALRTGAPSIVGALLRDSSNPIYGALHVALQRRADEVDMSIVAMTAVDPDVPSSQIRAIETMLELRVSGILVCSGTYDEEDLAPMVGRTSLISLARAGTRPDTHSVAYDEDAAGVAIAEAILERGHRRIAVHTLTREESISGYSRSMAITRTIAAAGGEIVAVPYTHEHDDIAGIDRVRSSGATVVACANDGVANRYLALANWARLSIPRDLSIVGCDHVGPFDSASLGLASYALPVVTTARAGVDLMVRLRKDPDTPIKHQLIQGQFVPGLSLGRIEI